MITLPRLEAVIQLIALDGEEYSSMTNEQLTKEFCLSGLFSDNFPEGYEEDFKVI